MTNSVSGVYTITAPNSKQYIGSSVNVRMRWNTHKYHLRHGQHANKHLQNSFDKYGEEAFKFEILLICETKDLIFFEQRVIDRFDPEFNTYKIAGSPRGYKHTPEAIEKIRKSSTERAKNFSDEHRERISAAMTGRKRKPFSAKWRRKMSESRLRFFGKQIEP